MDLFHVYSQFDITPVRAEGNYLYDANGVKYLDLYGGHGVISVGHSHPHYVARISAQLQQIGFYSNSVNIPIQAALAEKLGQLSGYPDYHLFLCNSGAEANENAIKLASFHTGRKKVIAFRRSFHGRTAGAVNITDNQKISAPVNLDNFPVTFLELNATDQARAHLVTGDVCAVIVEGIQGVGGLDYPSVDFLRFLSEACQETGTCLILDEVQSGYGRSGAFFAHQHAGIRPDLIPVAKGMGNGFPVAGVLISPVFEAKTGMLGTTFGGNHLACAAALAVLEIMEDAALIENARSTGAQIAAALRGIPGVQRVKGMGLMLGVELADPIAPLQKQLLFDHHIFTGSSSNPHVLRILPPLGITYPEVKPFIESLNQLLA